MSILKSLLITSFISLLFSYGLRNTLGFWETFAIATGMQIVFAFIYNSYRIAKQDSAYSKFEQEFDDLLSLSRTAFECPCGNHIFEETVFVNLDNIFKCEKCGNTVRAGIKLEPTLQTEIISEIKTIDTLRTINEKEL